MSGPIFRTAGAAAQSASAAALTPALPAVDTNGNGVVLAVVFSANNAAHSNGTAGWSLIGQQNSGASFTASLWVAAQGAAAPAFTWTGAAACGAQVLYWSDPAAVTNAVIGAHSVSFGTANPHTTTSITTGDNLSLAVLIDIAAANTGLAVPTGWTNDANTALSTAGARITADSMAVAASGTATGATSATGANAAWVAWQIEIQEVQPAAGFQSSKLEASPWVGPPDGFDASKLEVAPWLTPPAGFDASKLEAAPWVAPPSGFDCSKLEWGLWLAPFPPVTIMPLVFPGSGSSGSPSSNSLPGLSVNQKWTPRFFNTSQTTATGAELDIGLSDTPLHDFELIYNYLRDGFSWRGSTEFKTLIGFYGAMQGNLGRCLYKNPDDYSVQRQNIGTTDGTTRLYTLSRTFGAGEYSWTEPVGALDQTQPFTLYLDGVWQDPSSYALQLAVFGLQQVLFNSIPAAGKAITVDMNYYYYCKIPDEITFDKFMNQLWLAKKVTLRSCRPGA